MKRWLILVSLLIVAAVAAWLGARRSAPPEVPFGKVKRETLVSVLATNGRTEPLDWSPVHAMRPGRIAKVAVEQGQQVPAGAVLVVLGNEDAESAVASSQARVEQAQAELAILTGGGRAAELAQIESNIQRLTAERDAAAKTLASTERLVRKQAAPAVELEAAQGRLATLEIQLSSEKKRREAMVMQADMRAARAKVAEAESGLAQAKKRLEEVVVRSPRAGIVYDLPARAGAWANEGELLAKVGETSQLKVVVHVDEPDLGKIREGQPVSITWDAMSGKEWSGVVRRAPSQVVALGTRMVGEVDTLVQNPGRDLPPGANINARIRAQVVEGAVTIPKSALRRVGTELGVYVLKGGTLEWRKVVIGASSEALAEIREGLKEGDSVALPTEMELRPAIPVTPIYP
ncbi:MAG: efflux RND transporter periplasmic adaptor subunit [Acidobacteria bacterium]|nr:efflux RND transporter periplasmic adaptor subunit [Acidobacteriota bacterium]